MFKTTRAQFSISSLIHMKPQGSNLVFKSCEVTVENALTLNPYYKKSTISLFLFQFATFSNKTLKSL